MWIKQAVLIIIINKINLIVSANVNITTSNGLITQISSNNTSGHEITSAEGEMVPEVDDVNENLFDSDTPYRRRKKRQSGAGKFVDAAKMSEMKLIRMYLQLFKNVFSSAYVGGAHPLHHDVPRPVIYLFKQRVIDFLTPQVGGSRGHNK